MPARPFNVQKKKTSLKGHSLIPGIKHHAMSDYPRLALLFHPDPRPR